MVMAYWGRRAWGLAGLSSGVRQARLHQCPVKAGLVELRQPRADPSLDMVAYAAEVFEGFLAGAVECGGVIEGQFRMMRAVGKTREQASSAWA